MLIERFEENIAVLETDTGEHIQIFRSELPDGAREGGILIKTELGYKVDEEETAKAREKIIKLQNRLWK